MVARRDDMSEASSRPERRARRTRQTMRRGDDEARLGKPHYRRLVNSFEPMRLLSDDHVAAIHAAALGILVDKGLRVLLSEARDILVSAGGIADPDTQYVKIGSEIVGHALSLAPRE